MTRFQRTTSPATRLLLCGALLALLGACSSTPMTPTAATPPQAAAPVVAPAGPSQPPAAQPKPAAASTVATVTLPAYLDPKSPISTDRSVYFDFDAYTVGPDYSALLERHSKFLLANPAVAIKIAGNADERGSSEYNLALGQRRAEAVQRAMKVYGVKETQMEPISFGKEKPKAAGHDEAAWAQNRRADLQYPGR